MTTVNRDVQEKIMNDILIKHPNNVYFQYMIDDPYYMRFIDNRNGYNKQKRKKFFQFGGGKVNKIKYNYDKTIFVLFEKEVNGTYDISINKKNDIDDYPCLQVTTDRDCVAYIQHINYFKDCVKTGLEYPGGGSILLKLCIHFLTEMKERYKINKIVLRDTSFFHCKANSEEIHLALLHTLIFGITWYGKYGFRPYDSVKNRLDERLYKKIKQNHNIVNNTNACNLIFHNIHFNNNK